MRRCNPGLSFGDMQLSVLAMDWVWVVRPRETAAVLDADSPGLQGSKSSLEAVASKPWEARGGGSSQGVGLHERGQEAFARKAF